MIREKVRGLLKLGKQFTRVIFGQSSGNVSHLFIVGAQKAGTTALHKYLEVYPEILIGDEKEISFFSRNRMYKRGFKYYYSQFPISTKKHHILLDSSPEYLYYQEVASRIFLLTPKAKIIIVLRDPVDRALSAYNMYLQLLKTDWFKKRLETVNDSAYSFFKSILNGECESTLELFLVREKEIIQTGGEQEEPSLIRRGLYYTQIKRFVDVFGESNVRIIFSDELKKHTGEVVKNIEKFVGLKSIENQVFPLHHVRKYTVDLSSRDLIKEYAMVFFDDDKIKMEKHLKIKLPWACK